MQANFLNKIAAMEALNGIGLDESMRWQVQHFDLFAGVWKFLAIFGLGFVIRFAFY